MRYEIIMGINRKGKKLKEVISPLCENIDNAFFNMFYVGNQIRLCYIR